MLVLSLVFFSFFLSFFGGILNLLVFSIAFFVLLLKFSSFWLTVYGGALDVFSFLLYFLTFWLFQILFIMSFKYKKSVLSFMQMNKILSLLSFLLFLTFLTKDLLGFYIFFEFSLVPLFFIIVGWGYQTERLQAAFYLFMYTMVGSLPLLAVLVFVNDIYSLVWVSMVFNMSVGNAFFLFCSIIILVSMLIKLPMYGVHLWLPKAHVEAPASGSMVLAAVMLKLGAYGVYRTIFFSASLFIMQSAWWVSMLLVGALLSVGVAMRQSDMKSLVAFSSVGHMGVLMAGVMFFTESSLKGSLIMLVAHGFCSSALFFLVNFVYERCFSRQIQVSSGQGSIFYSAMLWWFLFLIMNFSAPPFISLAGELLIMVQAGASDFFNMVLLMVISFGVAYFSLFLYSSVAHGKISFHWSLGQPSDVFFLLLSFHAAPMIWLLFILEFLWFY